MPYRFRALRSRGVAASCRSRSRIAAPNSCRPTWKSAQSYVVGPHSAGAASGARSSRAAAKPQAMRRWIMKYVLAPLRKMHVDRILQEPSDRPLRFGHAREDRSREIDDAVDAQHDRRGRDRVHEHALTLRESRVHAVGPDRHRRSDDRREPETQLEPQRELDTADPRSEGGAPQQELHPD